MQPELVQFICETIREHGPQPFSWFMEQALYHPAYGYYSSGRAVIGRSGDYFTNVSVGAVFGKLIAAQFVEIWECLGKVDDFVIVEQGANDGQFAYDLLNAIRFRSSQMFESTRYQIVEPFPILRERQSEKLRDFIEKISWVEKLDQLKPFVGIHFSNELLDAMPVNLRNKSVGFDGDKLIFVETPDIRTAPNESQLHWIDEVARKLQRGFVIPIDYGFAKSDFHEVVQARSQHRILDSPFEQIGEADISVHVNWTDIAGRSEKNGFKIAGFTDQHHFITGIVSTLLRDEFENQVDAKAKRELQTLLHPEMLGRAFQVLALGKNIDFETTLAGFQFARDPRITLELE